MTNRHRVIVVIPLALVGLVGFLLGLAIALIAIMVFPFGVVTFFFFVGGIGMSLLGGHLLLIEALGIPDQRGQP